MTILPPVLRLGVAVAVWFAWPLAVEAQGRSQNQPPAMEQEGRQKLIAYLDGIAETQLATRKQAIAQIQTAAEADRRKAMVREKLLQLIGGLPERHGSPAVKTFGTMAADGFRVEKIAYESLPGFWVTADLYVPGAGAGPFPVVVLAPGHGAAGKLEHYSWGANLALNGIAALAYDPVGQGERLQYFDPDLKGSKIGGPTAEHSEANTGPLLIGDDVARYWLNDAIRGVDYLVARKDIDANRIGAFGCSGGGTATAHLAALDDRIKAAATACYITSFHELLPSRTGNQEAEQSIPHFIEQGLDFADWVEQMAPKPYAIVSTSEDMFPFEGARQTYDEVKGFYGIYGAADRVQWITGPGGHGNLGPISPEILGFFTRYLKGGSPERNFTAMRVEHREDLQCTPTGQVATSIGGETVYSLNRKRAAPLLAPQRVLKSDADLESLRSRLRQDIAALAAVAARPGSAPPAVDVKATEARSGYRIDTIALHSEPGIDISGIVAIPASAGPKPAVLLLDSQPRERLIAAGGDLDRLATAGRIVMVLEPRPSPSGAEANRPPFLGSFYMLAMRAFLVGKTLVGMRTDDVIRAMDWLCARPDVDRSAITAYGNGPMGMALLHAAALDTRIGQVMLENTLTTYRMIVDQPIHRNANDVLVPGVLRKYDTGDLMLAAYPRPMTVINPQDALGIVISDREFRKEMDYVFRSDQNLGQPGRIRLVARGPRDPLPIH
jgi:cephalosporin-C deacetylase-like acetyl esterase